MNGLFSLSVSFTGENLFFHYYHKWMDGLYIIRHKKLYKLWHIHHIHLLQVGVLKKSTYKYIFKLYTYVYISHLKTEPTRKAVNT
ncbi:unnamed protein product [Orchesella dallaii]|uniref:Uncharacterized protein n=1 Tax=Orchesella dallaii TaxID=48710 RepID=A0ABP1S4U1_9HEXA